MPGSVTLVGGEPGVGKSTLLLQVLRSVALGGGSSLLVSGEESAQQVRVRAERLGPLSPGLFIVPGSDVSVLGAVLDERDYDLVVVDSIQAVSDPATTGIPGSMAQVRACSDILTALAKERGVAFVLVGHVTKDGSLAGPRVLEHLVDTVLSVEGDRHHALRLVRAVKHRFGSTGELGLFEMGEEGMAAVADPYALLLGDRRPGVPGGAVFPAIEGQRPLLVEIQALVSPSFLPQPRRSVQGIEAGRLAVLLGVLACRLGIITAQADVFASAVGGVKVGEPAGDLALAMAVASAIAGVALPADLVFFGEVGLGGEIRQVPHAARRLSEAARLGFGRAMVPLSAPEVPGIEAVRVGSLAEAMVRAAGASPGHGAPPGHGASPGTGIALGSSYPPPHLGNPPYLGNPPGIGVSAG